ncbi:hypothetical protein [Pseudomonas sp. KNUC1026]|uniref:hypothetical protein n=1 Tax=Pseudomonas sp. KNUC1026 TaxID=2893890 RepID=UPI001F164550|nr:hypothetical protein [Pseudomonas sp. KNUC1026]UFH51179.1 hypothetical protein LN139_09150 [Pseudomonas sp. KNUC1026]
MFYYVEPEVAGGLGEGAAIDATAHPPVVTELEYRFDGWLGDEILESFPCFIVTRSLAQMISENGLSGFMLAPLKVTTSQTFSEIHPTLVLPEFSG